MVGKENVLICVTRMSLMRIMQENVCSFQSSWTSDLSLSSPRHQLRMRTALSCSYLSLLTVQNLKQMGFVWVFQTWISLPTTENRRSRWLIYRPRCRKKSNTEWEHGFRYIFFLRCVIHSVSRDFRREEASGLSPSRVRSFPQDTLKWTDRTIANKSAVTSSSTGAVERVQKLSCVHQGLHACPESRCALTGTVEERRHTTHTLHTHYTLHAHTKLSLVLFSDLTERRFPHLSYVFWKIEERKMEVDRHHILLNHRVHDCPVHGGLDQVSHWAASGVWVQVWMMQSRWRYWSVGLAWLHQRAGFDCVMGPV